MITDIYIVYDKEEQIKELDGIFSLEENSPTFHFINSQSNKTKKVAWALKNRWASKIDPFVLITNGDKAVKAFYSETGEDVIESLLNYLNVNENTNLG